MSTASINGTRIFYQVEGTGMPCLVMHGGLGLDHTYFRPWLDPLMDLFRMVYFDHRGNGRSDSGGEEPLTFDQLCADADALRAFLGFDRTAVIGHSIGSFVALEYALRYPERVSHLILIGTASRFDYIEEVLARARQRNSDPKVMAALTAPPGADDAAFGRTWRKILPLYFHGLDLDCAEAAFRETVYRASAAACNMDIYTAHNVSSRLPKVQAPTLIVAGDDDFITPPSQASLVRDGVQNASLAVIDGCGHFPFIECPHDFVSAVRSWYAALVSPESTPTLPESYMRP